MNYVDSLNLFGVEARQTSCIKINGVPTETTEGAVGVLAIDVDSENKDVYKCVAVNEDGTYDWDIISSGNGDGVQGDWNQNDSNAPDYINNRTHYQRLLNKSDYTVDNYYTFEPKNGKVSEVESGNKNMYYWLQNGKRYTLKFTGYLNDEIVFTYENSALARQWGKNLGFSSNSEDEDFEIEIEGASDWSSCPVSFNIWECSSDLYHEYEIFCPNECDLIKVDVTGDFTWMYTSGLDMSYIPGIPYYRLTPACQDKLATKEYVDDQLNTIETSLDNIIAKYGLGGDTV